MRDLLDLIDIRNAALAKKPYAALSVVSHLNVRIHSQADVVREHAMNSAFSILVYGSN